MFLLQDKLLKPILELKNQEKINELSLLEESRIKRVENCNGFQVAFSMYPTSMQELFCCRCRQIDAAKVNLV